MLVRYLLSRIRVVVIDSDMVWTILLQGHEDTKTGHLVVALILTWLMDTKLSHIVTWLVFFIDPVDA